MKSKSEDFPSLDLCKKLTEAKFPETERCIWDSWNIYDFPAESYNIPWERFIAYVCPSIAELFHELPLHRESLTILSDKELSFMWWQFEWSIPDALADIWLWLQKHNK